MDFDKTLVSDKNPFLNHLILETLFKVASVEALRDFRLVNKLWWEKSLPHFRSNYRLSFQGEFEAHSVPWEKVDQFLEWVNLPNDPFLLQKYPFQKYNVSNWRLRLNNNPGLHQFWEDFGPLMKDLKIENCRLYGVTDTERILFDLTPNLESLTLNWNWYHQLSRAEREAEPKRGEVVVPNLNLKKLIISLKEELIFVEPEYPEYESSRRGRSNDEFLPISWTNILKTFPNLKGLQLEHIDSDQNEYEETEGGYSSINTLLSVARRLRETTANAYQIEELNIVNAQENALYSFPRSTLNRLLKLQFPLTQLELDIGVHTGSSDFKKILEMYCETLKVLKVYRAPYTSAFTRFPFGVVMKSLEELQLKGPIATSLVFLENTPNLKILRILNQNHYLAYDKFFRAESRHGSDDSDGFNAVLWDYQEPISMIEQTDFSQLENKVNSNLVEFVNGDEVCTGEQMRSLAKVMPNLQRLRIGVGDDGFRVLCDEWKSSMMELELAPSSTVHAGVFAGILGDCHDASTRPPNITDLKYLRNFEMDMISSDDAIYKGLLRLPHLNKLSMKCAPTVSDEAFNLLMSKFSGFIIRRGI
ncbi:unnamed protein product [Orchesella dallaii]|uniref:F-box domain-containing protein n=1 Tax=Orchesella dallaii TaxID=48710 RepID=A0ABP1S882_9HEXA